MTRLMTILSVCVLLSQPGRALAQTPDASATVTRCELVLRDGSRLFGTVISQDASDVVFRTEAGATVTAKRAEITSLKELTGLIVDGQFLPPDPNATRLFFGPTGRSLEKGQTYFGVYEFVMPFVQVGVTDRLSIGGGTPLVFGLNDEGNRPFWITPKLQLLNRSRTQVAVGTFHVFNSHGDGGGVGYVVGTHGDTGASVTVGTGLAYGTEGGRSGVLMIGGERQVRRSLKVITENYVWKDGNGIASAGIRFFGDRLSADLAIAVPIGAESLFAFPMINFVYVFEPRTGSRQAKPGHR
jgi:hypothetical protein